MLGYSKYTRGIAALLLLVVLASSVTGVAATWQFATGGTSDKSDTIDIKFFPWEGEDVLPEEDGGYNQLALVEALLNGTMDSNGTTIGIGLNAPGSDLNAQIEGRKDRGKTTFGSMDFWDSAQMDSIFGLKSQNLSFMFQFIDETTKYLYTTGVNLGETSYLFGNPNYPTGTRIYPIYRTILKYQVTGQNEDGSDKYEWVAVKTVLGTAPSAYYDNDYAGTWLAKAPAFDPEGFAPLVQKDCEAGETAVAAGTATGNYIYLYPPQDVDYTMADGQNEAYFSIKAPANGTMTILMDADCLDAKVEVFTNAAFNRKQTSKTANGATTFTARSGTTYYFKVSGVKDVGFSVYVV